MRAVQLKFSVDEFSPVKNQINPHFQAAGGLFNFISFLFLAAFFINLMEAADVEDMISQIYAVNDSTGDEKSWC